MFLFVCGVGITAFFDADNGGKSPTNESPCEKETGVDARLFEGVSCGDHVDGTGFLVSVGEMIAELSSLTCVDSSRIPAESESQYF